MPALRVQIPQVFLNSMKDVASFPMALKIMRKSEIIRLKQVDHIRAEKQILFTLEHPFIVRLLATFQDEKRLCMLQEYVCGGELFSFLRSEGRLPNDFGRYARCCKRP